MVLELEAHMMQTYSSAMNNEQARGNDNTQSEHMRDNVLLMCLENCGLTIQDLIKANMRNIIETAKDQPQAPYVTAEQLVRNATKRSQNESVVCLK